MTMTTQRATRNHRQTSISALFTVTSHILLLLPVVGSRSISKEEDDTSPVSEKGASTAAEAAPPHLKDCGIWLAPSAIQGAGLGMYAGRNFRKGQELQIMGDCVIPIIDKQLHNQQDAFHFLWDEYIWNDFVVGTDVEAFENADGASPGFGSTANSFLPMVNVREGQPKKGTEGVHRKDSPGAGAFTPYYDRQSFATRDIAAGEEFYVNYGQHWFEQRTTMGSIPLFGDLDRATKLFVEFQNLKQSTKDEGSLRVMDDLWETFVRNSPFTESRVIGSFDHDSILEMQELEQLGSLKELRRKQATRTSEWLYKFGTCGDSLFGNTSTIEHAGRGAFASHDLPEGAVLAQLPVIHIPNRSRLDMYFFDDYEKKGRRAKRLAPRPPQLLLNYCYGHKESTLLLCPYGPIVNYVNHNQTRVNVKLKWADPARGNFMPHLLNEPLESLEEDDSAKLAFELVATKEIQKGEEVFLDYGDEWEQAWQAHIASWKPHRRASDYVYFENFAKPKEHLQTVFETIANASSRPPPNLRLECNEFFRSGEGEPIAVHMLEQEMEDYDWFECEILRKSGSSHLLRFTAVSVQEPFQVLERLPSAAFRWREKPYTSDIFLENAFRHDIQIPDDIFPVQWRNLR